MPHQVIRAAFFGVFIVLLLATLELVYKKLKLPSEVTRKTAHCAATASTLVFPLLFDVHWYALALAVLFFLLLLFTRNTKYLKSIHGIDRQSAGSYLLPVAIYLPFLISLQVGDSFLFVLPILILAFSDPLAGLAGFFVRTHNPEIVVFSHKTHKTLYGSSAFFFSSLLISVASISVTTRRFGLDTVTAAAGIALAATLTELLSPKGTDNLSVPVVVLGCAILLRHCLGLR